VDLCVLGIGRNGHISFNEPGAAFHSRTRVVRLTETTRKVNASDFEGDRAPEWVITVGMASIFEARKLLLLASGANKAWAAAAALQGEISETVPASMLRRHPNATFLLDRDATSALDGGVA
jgi:glucosamine-6-phosphate deaminase